MLSTATKCLYVCEVVGSSKQGEEKITIEDKDSKECIIQGKVAPKSAVNQEERHRYEKRWGHTLVYSKWYVYFVSICFYFFLSTQMTNCLLLTQY